MKKTFYTNRKKSKIIALLLVLVMVVTPFSSLVGENTKAQGVNPSKDITITVSGSVLYNDTEASYYFEPEEQQDMTIYYSSSDGCTINLIPDIGEVQFYDTVLTNCVPEITVKKDLETEQAVDTTGASIVCDADATLLVKVKINYEIISDDPAVANTPGSTAAVEYISYTISGEDVAAGAGWQKTNAYDAYCAATTITGVNPNFIGEDVAHVGAVKYAVTEYQNDNNSYDDYEALTWSDTAPVVNETGTYIGFVGYFADAAVITAQTEPIAVKNLDVIKVDADEPTIVSAKAFYSTDGFATKQAVDVDSLVKVEPEYRYYIKATDAASGIKTVVVKGSDGSTYDITANVTDDGYYFDFVPSIKGDKYKVTITDNVGNVKAEQALDVIKCADSSKAEIKSYWNDDENKTVIDVVTNKKNVLTVEAVTYKSVNEIVVSYKENGTLKELSQNVSPAETVPYNVYSADFDLPDSDENTLLSDITVTLYERASVGQAHGAVVGTAVADLGTIGYDITEPTIAWDKSEGYIYPSNEWHDKSKPAKLVVKSGNSGAYESALMYATYSIDGENEKSFAVIDGSYAEQEIMIPSSKSKAGTKITVYARDMAGHAVKQEYVFYVDAEKPEILELKANTRSYTEDRIAFNTIPEISAKVSDNIRVESVKFECNGKEYITSDINGGMVKLNFAKELVENPVNGTYEVKVTAYDKSGNVSNPKIITFMYDTEKPTVTTKLVYREAGADWSTATKVKGIVNSDGHSYYYINDNSDTGDYALLVNAKDTVSGINEEKLKYGSWYSIDTGDDIYDGRFYIVIDPIQLDPSVPSQVKNFAIYDMAGNKTVEEFEPEFLSVDSNVVFKAQLLDSNKEPLKITSDVKVNMATGVREQYYVRITAEGPYEFKNIYIEDSDGEVEGLSKEIIKENDYSTRKRYKYEVIFALPFGEGLTARHSYLKAVADDGNKIVKQNLMTLLYDNSDPVIVQGNDTSKTFEVPEGWVKRATLDAVVLSGTNAEESDLNYARYSIDGGEVTSFELDGPVGKMGEIRLNDSASSKGTKLVIAARDEAGNGVSKSYRLFIDGTRPVIDRLVVNQSVDVSIPFTGTPVISTTITDNLTLEQICLEVTYPDGKTKKGKTIDYGDTEGMVDGNPVTIKYALDTLGNKLAPDGHYTVSVSAVDKAGNAAEIKTMSFDVDNTVPVVEATITGGLKSEKNPDYYQGDVSASFAYKEDNIKEIAITDNGSRLDVVWSKDADDEGYYTAVVVISSEGSHEIKINASDTAGHVAQQQMVSFVLDKGVPQLSVSVNGLPYRQGIVDLSADATISVGISDLTQSDLYYQVIETRPDQATITSQYTISPTTSFTFGVEGDYTMNFFAVDEANNQGQVSSVSFRIDKTAPVINVTGLAEGGISSEGATVNISVQEAFWSDAETTVNIYRRSGDGVGESLYKTVNMNMTAFNSSVSEALSDTGVYRLEVIAGDRVGHSVENSLSYTIDKDAPEIILSGIDNFDVMETAAEFYAEISDAFYTGKKVSLTGTRTDITGKVNNIEFSDYYQGGNPTAIKQIFEEDGIYDIKVSSEDIAGNSSERQLHFIVDKTKPQIGSLDKYDGVMLTDFNWDIDLDELVSDLTVCQVHMYLNGSEYDGESEIVDGSYTLLITAEDELGHYVEKTVSFVLDTKAPVFIVTGVENGEIKNEAYSIDISLQLEEDILNSVTLNNEEIEINNGVAHINVTEKGKYSLAMDAVDLAGNKSMQVIDFEYGEKTRDVTLMIALIASAAVLTVGGITLAFVKRKKR